jgi:hypothetical protein
MHQYLIQWHGDIVELIHTDDFVNMMKTSPIFGYLMVLSDSLARSGEETSLESTMGVNS